MNSPIQIKRPDVADDIRELASLMGTSITEAVANAVRGQLAVERVRANDHLAKRKLDAEQGLERLRRLPVVGPTLTDDDLYTEEGLPK